MGDVSFIVKRQSNGLEKESLSKGMEGSEECGMEARGKVINGGVDGVTEGSVECRGGRERKNDR